jgi:hypothetical protein
MRLLKRAVQSAFTFRNWAVHPPSAFREPIRHPDLGAGVDWRFVAFSAANAQRAVSAAIEGLLRTFERSRPKELVSWDASQKQILDAVLAEQRVTIDSL